MAQKRMFDRAIIDTDKFMDLSMSSKALYFLLGMEADDEGFVSFKKVMRIHGGNEDDIKILVAKSFLIMFESGVVVITDWNTNNWLDSRRTRPTEYQKEKKLLELTESNKYVLSSRLDSIEENSIEENSTEYIGLRPKKESTFNPLGAEIIKEFESINPACKKYYSNKTQRGACDRLLENHSMEQIKFVIANLHKSNTSEYFPVITTPYELEQKWTKLASAYQKIKNKLPIVL